MISVFLPKFHFAIYTNNTKTDLWSRFFLGSFYYAYQVRGFNKEEFEKLFKARVWIILIQF